jgi:hypothetical protein
MDAHSVDKENAARARKKMNTTSSSWQKIDEELHDDTLLLV